MLSQQFPVQSGQQIERRELGFMAYSLVVENLTNQWYYEPSARRFIPPYQSGVIIQQWGRQSGDLQWASPASQQQAVVNPAEYLYATWTDTVLPVSAGVDAFSKARAAPIDRAQLVQGGLYAAITVPPHVLTTRWTYTVPTGRKGQVALSIVQIMRQAAAAPANIVEAYILTNVPSLGGLYLAHAWLGTNGIGDRSESAPSANLALPPGAAVSGATQDNSIGGSVDYLIEGVIGEFDA